MLNYIYGLFFRNYGIDNKVYPLSNETLSDSKDIEIDYNIIFLNLCKKEEYNIDFDFNDLLENKNDYNIDIYIKDEYGNNPLMISCITYDIDKIEKLLDKYIQEGRGEDIFSVNHQSFNILSLLLDHQNLAELLKNTDYINLENNLKKLNIQYKDNVPNNRTINNFNYRSIVYNFNKERFKNIVNKIFNLDSFELYCNHRDCHGKNIYNYLLKSGFNNIDNYFYNLINRFGYNIDFYDKNDFYNKYNEIDFNYYNEINILNNLIDLGYIELVLNLLNNDFEKCFYNKNIDGLKILINLIKNIDYNKILWNGMKYYEIGLYLFKKFNYNLNDLFNYNEFDISKNKKSKNKLLIYNLIQFITNDTIYNDFLLYILELKDIEKYIHYINKNVDGYYSTLKNNIIKKYEYLSIYKLDDYDNYNLISKLLFSNNDKILIKLLNIYFINNSLFNLQDSAINLFILSVILNKEEITLKLFDKYIYLKNLLLFDSSNEEIENEFIKNIIIENENINSENKNEFIKLKYKNFMYKINNVLSKKLELKDNLLYLACYNSMEDFAIKIIKLYPQTIFFEKEVLKNSKDEKEIKNKNAKKYKINENIFRISCKNNLINLMIEIINIMTNEEFIKYQTKIFEHINLLTRSNRFILIEKINNKIINYFSIIDLPNEILNDMKDYFYSYSSLLAPSGS